MSTLEFIVKLTDKVSGNITLTCTFYAEIFQNKFGINKKKHS